MENAIDVIVPPVYGKNSCSQISADPKVVALGPHPHWYEVGAKVVKLAMSKQEEERIGKTLLLAFSQVRQEGERLCFHNNFSSLQRFVDIFRHAQNWREQVSSRVTLFAVLIVALCRT
jgi:hypothetical protein